ncbi:related to SRP40 - serine-rich protein with a role in pre-ribosome assembly or transport [Melanopsichium pennsylvanicum]|uniref:Related to SRP40 - serine-rich protein with a role in pre-ribosome assembly or transport n=2 Tax=Melanopsichium pennsylvanicum TaxID=63383 RepID=A0AAJ4XP13_9BASI|nr:wd40 repeat-like protein [Melanopsichium pennsylvanicum 4]SNX85683.1 related to SRP40 - serine-rich protein with a role in pre-ribosome assembly or transport [Melanopsichium pennsylvanicum]
MVATRKRVYSDRSEGPSGKIDEASIDSIFAKRSATARRSAAKDARNTDDIVQIWQHGVSVADIVGDIIDPNWIPPASKVHVSPSLQAPYLMHTGTSYDTCIAARLPFGGTTHALAQSRGFRLSDQRYRISKGKFRFRESWSGHTSCVNALAFSRDQGRWLASAGDDREIHIRDMFVDARNKDHSLPIAILKGHESNVFSLSWSAQNKYLFSTGNDSQILYYDVDHSSLPLRGTRFAEPETRSPLNPAPLGGHDESVPELSAHPTNPNLLLSCDDGGDLKLIDIRIPHDGVASARSDAGSAFSSVQWNPSSSDGNTFAAATCGRITGSTRLYDVRQCFSSDNGRPLSSKDAVLSYHTALMQNSSKRGLIAASAETNSICFDPEGRFLASSISRYHPTIYAVNDPDPLVTLQSTVADDPIDERHHRLSGVPMGIPSAPKKLSSCCTIKHASFGLETQTGKLHYAIGSDDFRAYVFAIPSKEELMLRREFVNRHDWLHETAHLHSERQAAKNAASRMEASKEVSLQHSGQDAPEENDDDDNEHDDSYSDPVADNLIDHDSEIVYCAGSILRAQSIVRPARITQQAYVLCGGRSIINATLIHPTLPLILTAGITTEIHLHSASPLSSADLRERDGWSSDIPVNNMGGTRTRFLFPPSGASLIAGELESSDEYDEYDGEGDVGSEEVSDGGEEADESEEGMQDREDENDCGGDDGIDTSQSVSGEAINLSRPNGQFSVCAYGPAPNDVRESQQEENRMHDMLRANMAEDEADRARPRSLISNQEDSADEGENNVYESNENEAGFEDEAQVQEQVPEAATGALQTSTNRAAQRHGTVEDFLSEMRSDPMYTTPAPLDYHHDRHIGTYSLSHLPSSLILSESSSAASVPEEEMEEQNDQETSTSYSNESFDDEDALDDALNDSWDDNESREYNAYAHDGYGSTYAPTEELEESMQDDLRCNFQERDEIMTGGKFWYMCRSMDALNREQRRLRLFDELLRRDELRPLTAVFQKVPQQSGGKGNGSTFTCRSCQGRIDSDS